MTTVWGAGETILVVDDDRTVALAVKRQLMDAGYLVHTVASGADDFLPKPVHTEERLLRVRSLIPPEGGSGFTIERP